MPGGRSCLTLPAQSRAALPAPITASPLREGWQMARSGISPPTEGDELVRAVDIPHVAQLFILPGRDSQGGGWAALGDNFLGDKFPLQAWICPSVFPMSPVNWFGGFGLLG